MWGLTLLKTDSLLTHIIRSILKYSIDRGTLNNTPNSTSAAATQYCWRISIDYIYCVLGIAAIMIRSKDDNVFHVELNKQYESLANTPVPRA